MKDYHSFLFELVFLDAYFGVSMRHSLIECQPPEEEAVKFASNISESITMIFPPLESYKTETVHTKFMSEGRNFEFSIKSVYQ